MEQLISRTLKIYDNLFKNIPVLINEQIWWLKLKQPKVKTIKKVKNELMETHEKCIKR